MIKSIIAMRGQVFCTFLVENETENFVECSSSDFRKITFKKEKINIGEKIWAFPTWGPEGPSELTIVEITIETKEPTLDTADEKEILVANALLQLRAKAKIAQGDYVPNWDDNNPKYFPVFDMRNGGFAYSGTNFTYSISCTMVGSRLCFPSREEAKKFGVDNLGLYRILYKG